ncbi:MAG: HDOD domain-containing protein [Thermodesulfobacteriota bacterium]
MRGLPKHHVTTGSFYVGESKALIIEAYLGTCVGLAIHDKTSGVGGLLHLLLPEPVSTESGSNPDKYARTGVPRFLEALKAAGAVPHRMQAWIAGGALVGPLTRQDMALDIGGRTAEIALRHLKQEGIRIEQAETGGFFTCSLELNLTTWETRIQPAGFDKLDPAAETAPPSPEDIDRAISRLQPIPQVALKIMRLIGEDRHDFKTMASEVRKDQVLTAQTLRLCNSALFAGRPRIDSIEDALIILGQDALVKSILQVSINRYFDQSANGYALCKGGLFHHSIGTARIAEKLAQLTEAALPSVAYTAGLLHDIGMVVLDQYVAGSFPYFYRGMQLDGRSILTIERELFGIDHPEIGKRLAARWSFPASLTEAVALHHEPEKAVIAPELTHIVYLAELLMSRFHTGLELERSDTDHFDRRLAAIGLSRNHFIQIVDRIPAEVFGELLAKTMEQPTENSP